MVYHRNRSVSVLKLFALSCVISLAMPTVLLAQDGLKGCWVGTITGKSGTIFYLNFSDDSNCTFNNQKNCEVEYPLSEDQAQAHPGQNIRLVYQVNPEDRTQDVELFGTVDLGRGQVTGDGFSFSKGDTCPLPSASVQPRNSLVTPTWVVSRFEFDPACNPAAFPWHSRKKMGSGTRD